MIDSHRMPEKLSHKPVHAVSPSFVQPDGQSPHVQAPGVLVHLRLLSHPPLFFRHSLMSENGVEFVQPWLFSLRYFIGSRVHNDIYLCTPYPHGSSSQVDSHRMPNHHVCWCIYACCRIRRYFADTRSRLRMKPRVCVW